MPLTPLMALMPLRQPLKVVKAIFVIPSMKCEESQVFFNNCFVFTEKTPNFAYENNIELGSSDVYMSSRSLSHSEREHKVNIGKAVEKEEIIAFPITRHEMEMSYDGEAFIFTNGNAKFVIHPNYEIKIDRKKTKRVVFITATQLG